MIILSDNLIINKGTNRICYKYPNKKSRCLKVDIKDKKETLREIKYYKRLIKKKIPFTMLSKYYGQELTNYGNAEVFELIRNEDGTISEEIDKFLLRVDITVNDIENLLKLLPSLKEFLFSNKIYVKDLNTVNILYQLLEDNQSRLVIIDGLSHGNYNPLFYNCDFFILKKIKHSWNLFIANLKKYTIINENRYLKKYLS